MMSMIKIIQLVAVASGLIAALALFYGSIGVPWHMQTVDGVSDAEKTWKKRQFFLKWVGLPAAVISAGCQVAAIFWPTT